MKHLKKMLALVMAICLCIGLLPGTTYAAETPEAAAIFASDIHEENTSLTGSGTSALQDVLKTIGENGVTYDTMGFVGDTYTDIAGKAADMTSAAQTALGQNAEVYYAYGDHDEESDISPDSGLLYSGDYYIYHISDANMRSSVTSQSDISVETAIANFTADVAEMDKTKVLFIMSHVPLHDRRNDNTYANDWYTAITAAAETMDVVVFWAHNHTGESSVDTAAYYVAKDGSETMTIYGGSAVVPNFTYMNAGYIYAAGQSPYRKGVATTVEIYSDSMVFQDYNSSGEYTDSKYSHNVTVAREFAVTKELESIAVTTLPTTTYYVGDTFDDAGMVVTATYDDDTTATVTGYTVSEPDMTSAGTKTVTVTYEGKSTSFEILVKEKINTVTADTTYIEDDGTSVENGNVITATGLGLTAVSAVFNDVDLSSIYGETNVEYSVYDVTLSGYAGGTVDVSFDVYNVDLTGAVVYLVDSNNTTKLTGTVTTGVTAENVTYSTVTFTVPADAITNGAFTVSFGVQEIIIPEGYVLESLDITNPASTLKYFVDEDAYVDESTTNADIALNITGLEVTATYRKDADTITKVLSWNKFDSAKDAYALSFDMRNLGTHPVNVSYTYEGVTKTTTYNVTVCYKTYEDDTDVALEFSTPEVTEVNVADESENKTVANAVALLVDAGYKAYDIDLTGYTQGESVTVTLPIPTGVTNPVVYYVSDDGTKVEKITGVDNKDGTYAFTANHFSIYVVGDTSEVAENTVTLKETTTTTTTKTVYVLTSSISSGNDYLIADSATAGSVNLVANDGGDLSNTTATIIYGDCDGDGDSEYYIELTDATNELWTVTNSYRFENQDEYLRCSNGSLSVSDQTTTWSYSSNRLSYTSTNSRPPGSSNTTYYLRYNDGWTVTNSSSNASNIYFYVPTEVEVEIPVETNVTYAVSANDITHIYATTTTTDDEGNATTTVDLTEGKSIVAT